ncbi:hypothetical protein J2S03_001870 [Alicyclobacillus cycloheptanicus]|uniref:Uncharacterized protein n=1 Tax=Alicyclobacillus cycloheptanicus TaxID=1457 RepID=A0ABT9XIH7_9BACL|nr:hypothetical protein [Alicyclobacillus cycloheptanicus]
MLAGAGLKAPFLPYWRPGAGGVSALRRHSYLKPPGWSSDRAAEGAIPTLLEAGGGRCVGLRAPFLPYWRPGADGVPALGRHSYLIGGRGLVVCGLKAPFLPYWRPGADGVPALGHHSCLKPPGSSSDRAAEGAIPTLLEAGGWWCIGLKAPFLPYRRPGADGVSALGRHSCLKTHENPAEPPARTPPPADPPPESRFKKQRTFPFCAD